MRSLDSECLSDPVGISCTLNKEMVRIPLILSISFLLVEGFAAIPGPNSRFAAEGPEASTHEDAEVPQWLAQRLAQFDLQATQFSDTGRGLQTLRNRDKGEILLTVPAKDALTAAALVERFASVFEPAQQSSQTLFQQNLKEEQILAMGLLLLQQENDLYVASLPKQQYSVLTMPQELFASFPSTYQRLILAYYQYVDSMYQQTLQILNQMDSVNPLRDLSHQDFFWAFASVRSRCLAVEEKDIGNKGSHMKSSNTTSTQPSYELNHKDGSFRVMLPGFDLFNHQFGVQVEPSFQDQEYCFTSQSSYDAGDQVWISYSSSQGRDNLNMLLTYGFCPKNNPQGILFFDNTNLLQACAQARSSYFTPGVLQQLEGLMAKLGKTQELYVYDGKSKQPGSNLQKGLAMMAEIEQQFLPAGVKDDDFEVDVIGALLFTRQQELELGLKRAKSVADQGEDTHSWGPLLESIQMLLTVEHGYLATAMETCT